MKNVQAACCRLGYVTLIALAITVPVHASSRSHGDGASEANPVSMTPSVAQEAVLATVSSVEAIRGLEFKRPVTVQVVDDAAVRKHAIERLNGFYTEEQLRAQQAVYTLLGLVPEGTDILEEYFEVMEEQAGGFYDPSKKSFFLLDDMPAGMAPILAAHELTHALEDQHFDLDQRVKEVFPDEDRVFARSAVHEGSAMLVMSLYLAGAMADGTLSGDDLQAMGETEAMRGKKLSAMPAALRRPLLAVYFLGLNFLGRGDPTSFASGFPQGDVDLCYREGPLSSEQILHPEKFWDPALRDDPTPVDLGKAGRSLGRGWHREETGVMGELILGVLVGAPTPSGPEDVSRSVLGGGGWSNAPSAGWDGDRWEIWSRGDSQVVLLKTVWDSPEDAEEFGAALESRPGLTWKVRGNVLALVAGDAEEKVEAVLEALLGEPRRRKT